MEPFASFNIVYNQFVEERQLNDSLPYVDEPEKELKKLKAFLRSLGIQPSSFKSPKKEDEPDDTDYILKQECQPFCFNEDGQQLVLNFFRYRTSALYKGIRRKKFSPEYLEKYQIIAQQLESNMRALGHNEGLIQLQKKHFWLTITKDRLYDYLTGFHHTGIMDYIKNYTLDDTMKIDLIYLSQKMLKDYQLFQEKWMLCVKNMMEFRKEEAETFIGEPWGLLVKEYITNMEKYIKEDDGLKFKSRKYLENELYNANIERQLDKRVEDYIADNIDELAIMLCCTHSFNKQIGRRLVSQDELFEACMNQALEDLENT